MEDVCRALFTTLLRGVSYCLLFCFLVPDSFSFCLSLLFLQAQFSQIRPVTMAHSVAPRMPIYPPGGPAMGQQIFYGQAPPAIIPSQVISCLVTCLVKKIKFLHLPYLGFQYCT